MSRAKAKLARWADEWKLALAGVGLALRSWRFCAVGVAVFVFFCVLLNMLTLPSSFRYLVRLPLGRNFVYLGEMFVGAFEYPTTIMIAVLQAVIIGLIAMVWWKKRREKKLEQETAAGSGAHLSKAGIVTGLAVLAGGCPTCGTSLLAPLLGAVFSGSSAAVGSTISWVLTALAIVIALLSFKKVGLDAYVIIVSERRRNRKNGRKQSCEK